MSKDCELMEQAIIAIKEALAQPEKGLFIDLIAQHEGLADELAQPEPLTLNSRRRTHERTRQRALGAISAMG